LAGSVAVAAAPTAEDRRGAVRSRRRIGFGVLSWLIGLGGLAVFVFALAEIVLMWLPGTSLLSLIDDLAASDLDYRAQFHHLGITVWALAPALIVQVRRPERRVAAMLQALAVAATGVVVMAVCGALQLLDVVVLVLVGLLGWLHPRSGALVSRPRFDRRQLFVVALGALPWLALAGSNVPAAWAAQHAVGVGDTSAQVLWANSALMPVVIVVVALVGSTGHPGRLLPAWTAALAAVDVGLHSLVFPNQAASLPVAGAVAAITWGALFAVASAARSRSRDEQASSMAGFGTQAEGASA
jgi:hypothetical protein